jgi:hypothetical protein
MIDKSSAEACTNRQRLRIFISCASDQVWLSKSCEMSLKITRLVLTFSRAPKAISPSPQPTSSSVHLPVDWRGLRTCRAMGIDNLLALLALPPGHHQTDAPTTIDSKYLFEILSLSHCTHCSATLNQLGNRRYRRILTALEQEPLDSHRGSGLPRCDAAPAGWQL